MAESRTFNPDGTLSELIVDNNDKDLVLQLESLSRTIPFAVKRIIYQELDVNNVVTRTIDKTREQLLNLIDTYSYRYNYTYYPGKEVDTIRTRVYDASNALLSDQTLKHYLDGRLPEYI